MRLPDHTTAGSFPSAVVDVGYVPNVMGRAIGIGSPVAAALLEPLPARVSSTPCRGPWVGESANPPKGQFSGNSPSMLGHDRRFVTTHAVLGWTCTTRGTPERIVAWLAEDGTRSRRARGCGNVSISSDRGALSQKIV